MGKFLDKYLEIFLIKVNENIYIQGLFMLQKYNLITTVTPF